MARYTVGEVVIADYVLGGWADHIASWHPAVALAVADWLDLTAERAEVLNYHGEGQPGSPQAAALTVARAYLGEANAS